jgi:NADH-quinone oxidoreductase subunit C
MDAPALVAALEAAVPGAALELAPTNDLQTTIYVPADRQLDVAQALRDRPEFRCTVLIELTAVDLHPDEPRFQVVYTLLSIEHRLRIRLKVRVHGESAHIATVSGLWAVANWLEREVWDLFGIVFDGHPDPRRLLMPEDWEGFPLRKDYPVQIRMTPKASEPLQVTEDEFRANLERDRLTRQ